jgi:hypothetical protein
MALFAFVALPAGNYAVFHMAPAFAFGTINSYSFAAKDRITISN